MNKNLMIGLGVLAVAGIGLYVYNKRKKGEKLFGVRGDVGSTFGSHFGSSSADGETEMASEDVRDCGCKYKDTDDSTVFSIARPKYSNAYGRFTPRITEGAVYRQNPCSAKGTTENAPCTSTDANNVSCSGKMTLDGQGGCYCKCPEVTSPTGTTGNQPTRYMMPRKRGF